MVSSLVIMFLFLFSSLFIPASVAYPCKIIRTDPGPVDIMIGPIDQAPSSNAMGTATQSTRPYPSARLPAAVNVREDVQGPVAGWVVPEATDSQDVEASPEMSLEASLEPSPEVTAGLDVPTLPKVPTVTANPDTTENSGGACFPGGARVVLEGGFRKKMRDLDVGDSVQVGPGVYSPVFMFTHRVQEIEYRFISISSMDSGNGTHNITLTRGHLMYVNGALVAAEAVRRGDILELGGGGTSRVNDVHVIVSGGLYNPQTIQGDIVVDGIRASTFTTAVRFDVARALLLPFRLAYISFGWYTNFFDNGADGILPTL